MIYSPLDEGNDQIRVLRFKDHWQPESVSKPLRISIETVSLNDKSAEYRFWQGRPTKQAHHRWQDRFTEDVDLRDLTINENTSWPTNTFCKHRRANRFIWGDYEALSYAWGQKNPETQILLDNSLKAVSCTLEEALRILHRLPETQLGMRYWVDQLCINQEDLEERNHQVKRIKIIYIEARAVVVWLGPGTGDDEKVVDIIRSTRGASKTKRLFLPSDMNMIDWIALCEFMRKPYWQRLWIIQELATNSNATLFLCGALALTREMVSKAVDCCQKLLTDNVSFTRDGSLDTWTTSLRVFGLVNLNHELAPELMSRKALILARQATATQDKDKVYGILGLLSESIASQITPDYSDRTSVQHVFTELTIAIIRAENNLEQIIYGEDPSELGWPSWVPDLRLPFLRCHIKYLRDGRASKTYPPQYHFLSKDSTTLARLCVEGIRVDTIDGIAASPASDDPPIYPFYNRCRYTAGISQILGRTLVMDHPKTMRRPAFMNLPWNLNRENCSLRGGGFTSTCVIDDPHFEVFQRFREGNKEFCISGQPLRDYFPVAEIRKEKIHALSSHLRLAVISLKGRRLATTSTGYMCLVPEAVLKGDVVVVLFGCNFPLLLRQSGGVHRVIGECFVPGLMDGEVFCTQIEEGLPNQTFILA